MITLTNPTDSLSFLFGFQRIWCFVNLVSIRPKGNCGLFEIKINKSIEDIASLDRTHAALTQKWARKCHACSLQKRKLTVTVIHWRVDDMLVMLVKTLIYNTLSHFPSFSSSNFATQKSSVMTYILVVINVRISLWEILACCLNTPRQLNSCKAKAAWMVEAS